jgi:hypothetical protein
MEPKLSSMELILAICTILGGLSAVWFFWDKIAIYWGSFLNLFRKNEEIPLLSLPDDEFMFIDKISKINFKGSYQPTSEIELQLCNSLVNYGVFLRQSDSSYKPTKEGKKFFNSATNT